MENKPGRHEDPDFASPDITAGGGKQRAPPGGNETRPGGGHWAKRNSTAGPISTQQLEAMGQWWA